MMRKIPELGFRTVRGYALKHQKEGGLTPALEDYLEMVYRLCQEGGCVRAGRLSDALHVKPSSVSKMISRLSALGYLAYDRRGCILLAEKGKRTGAYLLDRHATLERFFAILGNANPLEEAELAEHSLSPPTVQAIKVLLDFLSSNSDIQEKYQDFCKAARQNKEEAL